MSKTPGPGGVGSTFLTQLHQLTTKTTTTTTKPSRFSGAENINLVAVLRSKSSLRAPSIDSPLSLEGWSREEGNQPAIEPEQLTTWLTSTYPPPHRSIIIIDTTSSSLIAESYPLFLRSGIHVVTANKKAFSSGQSLFDEIYRITTADPHHPLVYHESSVGAGMPILSTLRELLATGDRVHKIEGVMSGSLSFLFNNFMPLTNKQELLPWSSHVLEAQRLGYTEPDPRDDLSGLDVARKLVILARVAGMKIDGPDAFPVQSLIPKPLAHVGDAEEFLKRLPAFDQEMEALRLEAEAEGEGEGEGKVLRYVGTADLDSGQIEVKMVRVARESPFAGLRGSANLFAFWTERYGSEPLVVQGAG